MGFLFFFRDHVNCIMHGGLLSDSPRPADVHAKSSNFTRTMDFIPGIRISAVRLRHSTGVMLYRTNYSVQLDRSDYRSSYIELIDPDAAPTGTKPVIAFFSWAPSFIPCLVQGYPPTYLQTYLPTTYVGT